MNPYLNHQMAQTRQADLLREGEEYRRAGLTGRPRVLRRVTARIARFTAGTRPSRAPVLSNGRVSTPRRHARAASRQP
jgi:hypothetical protein